MAGDTTLLQRFYPEPLLKPGWAVKVEPVAKHGIYRLPRDQIPEMLLPLKINVLPKDFSVTLEAATDTASQKTEKRRITEVNMEKLQLAQYRIIPLDRGISFKISQPGANFRFANKDGAVEFDYGSIVTALKNGLFSFIPEFWVFEDQSEVTLHATNMNLARTYVRARCVVVGFKYPLEKVDAGSVDAEKALTVRVGAIE